MSKNVKSFKSLSDGLRESFRQSSMKFKKSLPNSLDFDDPNGKYIDYSWIQDKRKF